MTVNYENFRSILDNLEEKLNYIKANNPTSILCKKGEDFEIVVYNQLSESIRLLNLTNQVSLQYTLGSHTFPDIIFKFKNGEKFGVEVKLSTNKSKGWKTNGNSVVGSTRDKDVTDIFVVFGKMRSVQEIMFKIRNYKDVVSNVVVTHSPRYLIDMETTNETNFFEISGITFAEMLNNDDPISLITSYFLGIGEKAWWLSDYTPATIRMMSELSAEERSLLLSEAFVYFPEVFSSNTYKFKKIAFWLTTEKSIVTPSLRDNFSAGGMIDIALGDKLYRNVSKIYYVLQQHISFIEQILSATDFEILNNYWGGNVLESDDLEDKKTAWMRLVCQYSSNQSIDIEDFMNHLI